MQFTDFTQLDIFRVPSPCFVVDEVAIRRNLTILNDVGERSGAKVLHALKAFSMFSIAPLTNEYLWGTCASGLHEARLAQAFYADNTDDGKGEIHVYSAAYSDADIDELLTFANHIVFNSPSQLLRFSNKCRDALNIRHDLDFGLRINPEHSEGEVALYDPCAPCSRLGTTRALLDQYLSHSEFASAFKLIRGLHFHTLCEQGFPPLKRTLNAVKKKFGDLLSQMDWLNFGGGHHITAPNYDIDTLVEYIRATRDKFNLRVYLEPGEAVAIGTGVLVAEILDIMDYAHGENTMPQVILDTSATCHMPDTLEMPYRADIIGAGLPNEKAFTYRLGGLTCLAGDVIGDYSFDAPLSVGERLIFSDMAHYTMVKTSTFNGTRLPAIAIWHSESNELRVVREFSYADFRDRLS